MNIRIKGIGKINDSTINLNGLTIVTGKNNSGKSTLGKILYSYIDSISNIQNANLQEDNSQINDKISNLLSLELEGQIQPVFQNTDSSFVEIHDDVYSNVLLRIKDNSLVIDNKPQIYKSSYKTVFVLDNLSIFDNNHFDSTAENTTLLNHEQKLIHYLKKQCTQSSFNLIISKINEILPGSFDFSEEGNFYIENGNKLKLSNLATGSKLFAILKILLTKGFLDDSTILIFDEPEAHLHPDWQNILAEIIALLVKDTKIKIVLTTHSPNFILALEANMRKYHIEDKTNFYQTKLHDNRLVDFECVDDNLEIIYADFLNALSASKVMREHFLHQDD